MTTITIWVEAEAVRSDWDRNKGKLMYAKLGRVLRKRPSSARPDCHLIRVDIDVPHTAFEHSVKVTLD